MAGLPLAAAQAALTKQGLTTTTTSAYSRQVPSGSVISATPAAGTRVRPGAPVALLVSKGVEQLAVPDETGKSQSEAGAVLAAAGFGTTVTTAFSDTVPQGTVIDQSPRNGTAGRGSTIALIVSKGPDVVVVPDLGGSLDRATAQLTALGLKARVLRLPGGPGTVLQQNPRPGQMTYRVTVHRGTTVTLYVI